MEIESLSLSLWAFLSCASSPEAGPVVKVVSSSSSIQFITASHSIDALSPGFFDRKSLLLMRVVRIVESID